MNDNEVWLLVMLVFIFGFAVGALTIHGVYGFEMTEQLRQDEQLSQICTFLNLGTPECYQIIGDIESTYEPVK